MEAVALVAVKAAVGRIAARARVGGIGARTPAKAAAAAAAAARGEGRVSSAARDAGGAVLQRRIRFQHTLCVSGRAASDGCARFVPLTLDKAIWELPWLRRAE